jgi:F0F1-type ATP synthase membrane subunit a
MEQFLIHKIVSLPPIHVGSTVIDLSITNSVLTMIGVAAAVSIFFLVSSRGQVVPGRLQASSTRE